MGDGVVLHDGRGRALRDALVACFADAAFDRVDLVVSFVMKSGVAVLSGALRDALDRGASVRVLTTDYLQVTDPDALTTLLDVIDDGASLQVRVFHDEDVSFHPKSYVFWSSSSPDGRGAGFVGSSNLSASGLDGGIEWNLRTADVSQLRPAFESLWDDPRATPLTHAWLSGYRKLPRPTPVARLGVEVEAPVQPPSPTEIQRAALDALEQTRLDGHAAGLVVMATGLGKTWLAAFDSARPSFGRVLVVAHRQEILSQTRDVFRAVRPDDDFGMYDGSSKVGDARVVFASVQTLSRRLRRFGRDDFDYIVVDEFHHAAASSYRKVIAHFRPKFLLGLTATPDRMDGADLLPLCGDNLVFTTVLVDGIASGDLCPFRYFGLVDTVDYEPIPWRGGRFDASVLTSAVATSERASRALEEWRSHGGGRALGFCVTQAHADYMASFFASAGVRAVAVHSGPTSAPRAASVDALRAGELQVIFSVDVFNEGVDVPSIESILMLRPTESPVVFLQQLGRGLRTAPGKSHVTVIDFIGNHRSFLLKPRTLLGLGEVAVPSTARVARALRDGTFDLPDGCSVNFSLEAVDLLTRLARERPRNALLDYCRSYLSERGERPTALQAFRAGLNPGSARGWFSFLLDAALLSDAEVPAVERYGAVLEGLEREPINKSYKLVTLLALLRDGMLRSGAGISRIAETSHRIVSSDPRLVEDVRSKELPDPASVDRAMWRDYWRGWPIAAWAGELRGKPGKWFRLDGERLVPTFRVEESDGEVFDDLVSELVEYRLARYLFGKPGAGGEGLRCRVSHTSGRPLVWLEREKNRGLPEGRVRLEADGEVYEADFVKIALNVMRKPGDRQNALPGVLRRWFGASAGQPGALENVVFRKDGPRWVMERDGERAREGAAVDRA